MLRDKENVFLDDVTVEELSLALHARILPVEIDGGVFLDTLLEIDQ